VQGFTTGGQFDDANVEILSSHFGQFGEVKDDYDVLKAPVNGDSDGIYIGGSHSTLFMKNSVVRAAGDDCIDAGSSNGGRIELEGCLIESCRYVCCLFVVVCYCHLFLDFLLTKTIVILFFIYKYTVMKDLPFQMMLALLPNNSEYEIQSFEIANRVSN
jgi:hypothetical protein